MPFSRRNSVRNILCGVRLSYSGASCRVHFSRFVLNTPCGTPRKLLATLPMTMSEPLRRPMSYSRSRAPEARWSSWSRNWTYSPFASVTPTLRGFPGQPEFGMVITRKCGCSAASCLRRSGVSSVDPSLTKRTSNSRAGRVCRRSESMQGSMNLPGLYTGMTTLTLIGIATVPWLIEAL